MRLTGSAMARKRTHSHIHIHPTTRDLGLFAYLGEIGLASDRQIHARFWTDAKRQTCVDRLERLVKGGYLRMAMTQSRGHAERVYWIERKAYRLLPPEARVMLHTGRPATSEIAHLLRTRAVVDCLYRAGCLRGFTTEHHLKSEAAIKSHVSRQGTHQARSQVADGRLILTQPPLGVSEKESTASEKTGQVEYLLEIDGAYFGKRLHAKIAALASSPLPVLWVTGSRARLSRLQRLCAPHPQLRPILFVDLVRTYGTPDV